MNIAAVKLDSPFHHCCFCTKAYSSEKSLNKHLRKKHALGNDTRHPTKDTSDPMPSASLAGNPESASPEDRLNKNDLLSLTVPLVGRSGLIGSTRRPPVDDDVMIICPECNGTIKSKKGVAKHYMCFHNNVYAAWKSGWFGRNVRLMDLTQEMIADFYANRRSKVSPVDGVVDTAEAVDVKEQPDGKAELTGMVLDSVDEADDSNLSGRTTSELLRISAKPTPKPAHRRMGLAIKAAERHARQAALRPKRSKLKTQLATTAPFFLSKDGKLEFNTNENPLDINCPFCITHKTTIKGLAKHCVNHHPTEYADWKNEKFGSVQLRYVRPKSSIITQALGELQDDTAAYSKAPPLRPATPSAVAAAEAAQEAKGTGSTACSIYQQSAKPDDIDFASQHAFGSQSCRDDHPEDAGSGSVTPSSVHAVSKEKPTDAQPSQSASAANLNIFDDDKQATPCPFCGELIFSKGMGKHCIYFHHEQYQEWKAGKFGSVPLRFVPNQVGSDLSELSERALKRREARKKNGISITLPLMENGQQAMTPTGDADAVDAGGSANVTTMRIKPSMFRGEIYRCGECDRVFDKSSSLSQHLRIHKYGPSMSKHGFQTQASWPDNEDGSVGDLPDDEEAMFACHYCESIFDSADELKQHFGQKHPDDAARGPFVLSEATADDNGPVEVNNEGEATGRMVRFICDLCHAQHRTKLSLSRHYRGHQLEKFSSVLFDERGDGVRLGASAAADVEEVEDEREPGELSPSGSADSADDASGRSSSMRLDKYFCGVCMSCFPSARSLSQHNRVHKFGSGSRPANAAGESRPSSADASDSQATGGVVCIDDSDNDSKDSEGEQGGLQISDTGDWTLGDPKEGKEKSADAATRSTECPAGCPKCGKTFRNKWFLRDHLGRCFAKALADGELEMRDLASLAGIPEEGQGQEVGQAISAVGTATESSSQKGLPAEKFECRQCGKAFSSPANLMKHNVVHTGSSVSCKTCMREFKMPCHLARHYCSAQQPDSGRQLTAPSDNQHQQAERGDNQCDRCLRTFQYASNLTVHKRFCQQHGGSNGGSVIDIADESSNEAPSQMILLDCEDEVHECVMCNETFADRQSLERHTANCSLKPAAQATTSGHQQRMPGAQPERERIPCPNCGKTYCRKDVLEAHLKTSCRGAPAPHLAGTSGPQVKRPRLDGPLAAADRALSFCCDLCPSQFSSSLGLVVHRSKCHPQFYGPSHRRAMAAAASAVSTIVGSDAVVGDYECDVCHRRFVKAMHLGKHRLICGGAAAAPAASTAAPTATDQGPLLSLPNRCPQCPRAFLTTGRLREHVLAVHGPEKTVEEAPDDIEGGLLLDDADVADDDEECQGDVEAAVSTSDDASAVVAIDNGEAQDESHPEADAYLCSECDCTYPNFDLLNRHLKEAHEIDSITPEAAPMATEVTAATPAQVLQPMQLTTVLTGARKRKSTPVSIC